MSTTDPRFIIVDNGDSSIEYSGQWFNGAGIDNYLAMYGPPYQGTLHGTDASVASFSFAFNGTQVKVLGSNSIRNDSGVIDPTWSCFVDGVNISVTAPLAVSLNNWVFCNQGSLGDGPHVLTVNATVLKNQTFWFDNIQYAPSASVSLDQAVIMVDQLDPQILYGSGWVPLGSGARMTNVSGSTVSFDFTGTAISWYGYIPQGFAISPSSGTYSIDGETPVDFVLQGLSSKTTPSLYNQKFFETGQLSLRSHRLQVVYQGTDATPLTITNLIIQNNTVSTPLPTAGSGSSSRKSVTTPAIVGGVIGGLALVLFFVFGFFLRRRQKHAAQGKASLATPNPFEYIPLSVHQSSISPNRTSGGVWNSQESQSTSPVMFGKGQAYHRQRPGTTGSNTDGSQSVEPWNTSSAPTSSSPPLSLPSNTEREVEAQGTLRPQRQGGNLLLHADSGIRMAASTSTVEVPPQYTPD